MRIVPLFGMENFVSSRPVEVLQTLGAPTGRSKNAAAPLRSGSRYPALSEALPQMVFKCGSGRPLFNDVGMLVDEDGEAARAAVRPLTGIGATADTMSSRTAVSPVRSMG